MSGHRKWSDIKREHTPDPRAALAEVLPKDWAEHVQRVLAERGVLLVTEADVLAALIRLYTHIPNDMVRRDAAAIFAALSAEVTE